MDEGGFILNSAKHTYQNQKSKVERSGLLAHQGMEVCLLIILSPNVHNSQSLTMRVVWAVTQSCLKK